MFCWRAMTRSHRIGRRGLSGCSAAALALLAVLGSMPRRTPRPRNRPRQPGQAAGRDAHHSRAGQGALSQRRRADQVCFRRHRPSHSPGGQAHADHRARCRKISEREIREDEDAKRMQRGEIVLKKFGLLDRDFDLKPFMLALLKDRSPAITTPRPRPCTCWTGSIQKPRSRCWCHELTHALQDQHTDLEKWNDQSPPPIPRTA